MTRRNDVAERLLAMMVGLLPAARRDWGRAMCAELEGIVVQRDRWSFAVGCATAMLRQFAVLKSLAYTVIAEAAVVGVVVWSRDFTYAPLRWGVVAIVLVLVGLATLGRVRGPLGPVAGSRSARLARGFGYLVVAGATIGFLAFLRAMEGNDVDLAHYGAPIGGAMLILYLAGFVAATSDRAIATGRTLRWGMAGGIGAVLLWPLSVLALGQIPDSTGLAVVMVVAGVIVAVWGTAQQTAQAWVAALFAGTTGSLLTVAELIAMANYAPARMIPDLAPAALTAADDLELSRSELVDAYLYLIVIGALIALALGLASRMRRPRPTPVAMRLTAGRTIEL